MASVLRLAAIDFGEKSACTSFALPSAICCACARVTSGDVWTVSPSALATGASESACSVHEVLKLICSRGELLPDLLPLQIRLDLRLHFVERARLLGRDVDEAGSRASRIRSATGPGDFARLHREHGVVERLHHRAARVAPEISARAPREPGSCVALLRELRRTWRDWPWPAPRSPPPPSSPRRLSAALASG